MDTALSTCRLTVIAERFSIALRHRLERMADGEVNGAGHLDLTQSRRILLSNSTKKRSAEIYALTERISRQGYFISLENLRHERDMLTQ